MQDNTERQKQQYNLTIDISRTITKYEIDNYSVSHEKGELT